MEILNSRYRELLRKERLFNDIKFFIEMRETTENEEPIITIKSALDHIKFLVGVANEKYNE